MCNISDIIKFGDDININILKGNLGSYVRTISVLLFNSIVNKYDNLILIDNQLHINYSIADILYSNRAIPYTSDVYLIENDLSNDNIQNIYEKYKNGKNLIFILNYNHNIDVIFSYINKYKNIDTIIQSNFNELNIIETTECVSETQIHSVYNSKGDIYLNDKFLIKSNDILSQNKYLSKIFDRNQKISKILN